MKANIHPKYNEKAQVVCSCGNMFTVGSTKDTIHVELCDKCHPFYTGQQRFVDTASRIDKFRRKVEQARPKQEKKKEEKQDQGPRTLREMLQALKK
ncbi:50S ribosomal protein L31 [Patescibacteria group bacterium]|nr:50S ribosomal protein L31 [Patescibacteria group bacterium]